MACEPTKTPPGEVGAGAETLRPAEVGAELGAAGPIPAPRRLDPIRRSARMIPVWVSVSSQQALSLWNYSTSRIPKQRPVELMAGAGKTRERLRAEPRLRMEPRLRAEAKLRAEAGLEGVREEEQLPLQPP